MVGTPGNRSYLHQLLGVWKAVFPMATTDVFPARLDAMIDLRHPLAVLANRMPWSQIESNLAPVFQHRDRAGRVVEGSDRYGPTMTVAGAGISPADRPRLPIRLMVALLYLKHAYKLSDDAVIERWAQDVYFQFFSGQECLKPASPAIRPSSAASAKARARLAWSICSRPPSRPRWPWARSKRPTLSA